MTLPVFETRSSPMHMAAYVTTEKAFGPNNGSASVDCWDEHRLIGARQIRALCLRHGFAL